MRSLPGKSTGIIVDFKTKDGDFSDGKKLAYDQHWQLAAYQVGLCLAQNGIVDLDMKHGHRPGAAIFVSRTHPGAVTSYVWSADEIAQGLVGIRHGAAAAQAAEQLRREFHMTDNRHVVRLVDREARAQDHYPVSLWDRFSNWSDRQHWAVQILLCLATGTVFALLLMAAVLIVGEFL